MQEEEKRVLGKRGNRVSCVCVSGERTGHRAVGVAGAGEALPPKAEEVARK